MYCTIHIVSYDTKQISYDSHSLRVNDTIHVFFYANCVVSLDSYHESYDFDNYSCNIHFLDVLIINSRAFRSIKYLCFNFMAIKLLTALIIPH